MKLIVGLGNPGAKYARHRHNVGFMLLDRIADRQRAAAWRRRFEGLATEIELDGARALLLKPETYMNESGRSVAEAARFYKVALGDIIVVHDELDLAAGKIRLKIGGGNAGHNGLRSVTQHLGNDYARLRIGIGHPGVKELVHGWVLSDFAKADATWLDPLLDAMAEAAVRLAKGEGERFLTDVALKLAPPPDHGPERKKGQVVAEAAKSAPGTAKRQTGHPAGERAAKRQSALAENLRKWLAGKREPE